MENLSIILLSLNIIFCLLLLRTFLKIKELKAELKERSNTLTSCLNKNYRLKKEFESKILSLSQKIKNYKANLEKTKNETQIKENKIKKLESGFSEKDELYENFKNNDNESILKITSLYSDFVLAQYELSAKYLENKKHPAFVEAKRIRELKIESKAHKEQYRRMLYKYELILQIFPELTDYIEDFSTINELNKIDNLKALQNDYDRVKFYLYSSEYKELNEDERNQLALDRYLSGRKSNWQIGRDYELYCGILYEKSGWDVEYVGMEQKLKDLGRDLIATKNNTTHVVQCKYWSKEKVIHEKHIIQLYGTAIALGIQRKDKKEIIPVFITNITLSEAALKIAKILGVKIEIRELRKFPRIKCNINTDEYGDFTKIYHLPFDQQYDRTKIKDKGEFYAMTVQEASSKGFRRAFRFFGY